VTHAHPNARLEAFCDGVFAIALTLLILDVRLPSAESLTTTPEIWRALRHMAPAIVAFVMSFSVILIAWVNHHANLKLVSHSSGPFIYANGFLLLTVVLIPFPSELVGTFLWTDHASPAVVLYNALLALQALAWVLLSSAALRHHLIIDAASTVTMRDNRRNGSMALVLYTVLAVMALWWPHAAAVVTAATWVFWLVLGMRMKHT
jgi:uncharacterized membrane protein